MNTRFEGSPYIQALHQMIFDGEADKAVRRLGIIAIALVRKMLSKKRNQVCDMDKLMRRIVWVKFIKRIKKFNVLFLDCYKTF